MWAAQRIGGGDDLLEAALPLAFLQGVACFADAADPTPDGIGFRIEQEEAEIARFPQWLLWQALISTAVGLAVAIPVYAGYNFLVSRVSSIVLDMERAATEIVNILTDASHPRAS